MNVYGRNVCMYACERMNLGLITIKSSGCVRANSN